MQAVVGISSFAAFPLTEEVKITICPCRQLGPPCITLLVAKVTGHIMLTQGSTLIQVLQSETTNSFAGPVDFLITRI